MSPTQLFSRHSIYLVIEAIVETEAGISLDPRNSGPAWAIAIPSKIFLEKKL
jgi:hypothetical protein